MYTRALGTEKLLVICNFYGNTRCFELPEEWDSRKTKILIANYSDAAVEKTITVRPYEALVLQNRP